ncbi:DUF2294 family protein [Bacillus sp. BGMRC 2118]|nr:DUF2294 family protein [Bacillus sp. BGMRC 2118]
MLGIQEELIALSSSISKTLKRAFGKGPETCYTVKKGNRIYVFVRNFMTPAEEILVNNQETVLVSRFRSAVISSISKDVFEKVSKGLNVTISSLSHDWNYHTNTGLMIMEVDHTVDFEDYTVVGFRKELLQLFQSIGSEMHKVPYDLKIVKYSQNICSIELNSLMFPLVFLLFKNGNVDLLISHSQEIKNEYMKQSKLFEEVFNRSIEDLFITWDFHHNKSYFVFTFERI